MNAHNMGQVILLKGTLKHTQVNLLGALQKATCAEFYFPFLVRSILDRSKLLRDLFCARNI